MGSNNLVTVRSGQLEMARLEVSGATDELLTDLADALQRFGQQRHRLLALRDLSG